MLKSFKVKNFHSVGEEQELCLEINKKDILDHSSTVFLDKYALNLVTCIVGHNASGKTTVLKALSFFSWWIQRSYLLKKKNKLPVESHKLRENENTEFEIEFFENNQLFKYQVALNRNMVVSEFFGVHKQRGFSYIFQYEREKEDWDFKYNKDSLKEINSSDLERFKKFMNVSMLSSLIETGYLNEISFFEGITSNVNKMGYHSSHVVSKFFDTSERMYENIKLREDALDLIKQIDLGIDGFEFEEAILRNSDQPDEEVSKQILKCIHASEKGAFDLELIEESNGTMNGLSLFSDLYAVLENGGVAIVDEIEDGLHPYVVKKLISLFEDPHRNSNKAQLIFATHQHMLLNDRTKTQIYLAEKDKKSFETEIYRLDEVDGVRNDENYFQKYLTGCYGATPNINWLTGE